MNVITGILFTTATENGLPAVLARYPFTSENGCKAWAKDKSAEYPGPYQRVLCYEGNTLFARFESGKETPLFEVV